MPADTSGRRGRALGESCLSYEHLRRLWYEMRAQAAALIEVSSMTERLQHSGGEPGNSTAPDETKTLSRAPPRR
jgi:hypothetical protein